MLQAAPQIQGSEEERQALVQDGRASLRQLSKMLISLKMTNLTTIFSSRALPPLRKQGVMSRSKPDDKADHRDSTRDSTRLVSRLVVLVSHLRQSLLLSSRRRFIARSLPAEPDDNKVEGPTTSSDNQGSTERPDKKARAASSAARLHMHATSPQ
jgi:hypothetical protein